MLRKFCIDRDSLYFIANSCALSTIVVAAEKEGPLGGESISGVVAVGGGRWCAKFSSNLLQVSTLFVTTSNTNKKLLAHILTRDLVVSLD
jgi:hypothetical protein